jgi:hypothetical protein
MGIHDVGDHQMSSVTHRSSQRADETGPADTRILLLVAVLGLFGGLLSAFGQQWLPDNAASLANSVGSWGLVAFVLALLPRRQQSAAFAGGLALASLVTGYYMTNQLRGYPASSRTVLFWLVAAVVAGPLLGLAAHWLRHNRRPHASIGAGLVSGMLIGEGIYGLRYISDTTYPPYWRGEIIVGALTLALTVGVRLRSTTTAALALVTTAITAVAFVFLYAANLPGLL